MRTKHAVRNIRLCTKDCLCLYVCPVGATDTENGQVDWDKCIGCGKCAAACPSGAISMVPDEMPPQQKKDETVANSLRTIVQNKMKAEAIALALADKNTDPETKKLAKALARSNRLMAEDTLREAGYMLPQSKNAHQLLEDMLKDTATDFPKETVEQLLELLKVNE